MIRRDPITGQIIRNVPEEEKEAAEQDEKKEFKRYKPPPKPPSLGEKISSWFKVIFKK